MNHEDISLELLFSDYMKLTPYYQETFKTKLLDNREDISHYCEKERITKAYDRAKEALEHGEIFEAYRLLISAKLYHCGTLTKKCYHIKDPIYRSYLESLLDSNSLPNEEEFHNSFKELVNGASSKISYYADSLIKTGILALMDSALKQAVTYDAFVTSLTKTETAALAYIEEILKKNQGWATIAVGKIVKDSGISRATFTNLFNKMSQSGVANVKNCGSKGTYIKIYEFC